MVGLKRFGSNIIRNIGETVDGIAAMCEHTLRRARVKEGWHSVLGGPLYDHLTWQVIRRMVSGYVTGFVLIADQLCVGSIACCTRERDRKHCGSKSTLALHLTTSTSHHTRNCNMTPIRRRGSPWMEGVSGSLLSAQLNFEIAESKDNGELDESSSVRVCASPLLSPFPLFRCSLIFVTNAF